MLDLVPLPFSTFGSIVDAGWRVEVYCPACYRTVPIDVTDALRPKIPFHARFRCQNIRPILKCVCETLGHLHIRSPAPTRVSSGMQYCELFCGGVTPWSIDRVLLGQSPWPKITNQQRFRCPGCEGRVAWRWHGGAGIPYTDGYKLSAQSFR